MQPGGASFFPKLPGNQGVSVIHSSGVCFTSPLALLIIICMSKKRKEQTMTTTLLEAIRDSGQKVGSIARATGLDRAALGRFVAGKQSLRLDLADRLVTHFG